MYTYNEPTCKTSINIDSDLVFKCNFTFQKMNYQIIIASLKKKELKSWILIAAKRIQVLLLPEVSKFIDKIWKVVWNQNPLSTA